MISFIIYNGNGINQILENIGGLFGVKNIPLVSTESRYYFKTNNTIAYNKSMTLPVKVSKILQQLDNLGISEQVGKENIFYSEDEAIESAKKLLKLEKNIKHKRK